MKMQKRERKLCELFEKSKKVKLDAIDLEEMQLKFFNKL